MAGTQQARTALMSGPARALWPRLVTNPAARYNATVDIPELELAAVPAECIAEERTEQERKAGLASIRRLNRFVKPAA